MHYVAHNYHLTGTETSANCIVACARGCLLNNVSLLCHTMATIRSTVLRFELTSTLKLRRLVCGA